MKNHPDQPGIGACFRMTAVALLVAVPLGHWAWKRAVGWPADPDSQLLLGVQTCQSEMIEAAFAAGASPDSANGGGTPLYWAAVAGDEVLVRRLLAGGADASRRTWLGDTPLAAAAARNHLGVIRLLLAGGSDVDQQAFRNGTALHEAAAHVQLDAVRLLLEHGAAVDARNSVGQTPLILAASRDSDCSLPIIRLLLEAGADVNARDHNGDNALAHARMERQDQTVDALRAAGATENVHFAVGRVGR